MITSNKIDVEYLPKIQSHKFDFEFKYPIVDDKLINDGLDKSGKRKYQIDKGLNHLIITLRYQTIINLNFQKVRKR